MLSFKMISTSIVKKIRYGAKMAYLHTALKRFFTDSTDWWTGSFWVDVRVRTAHTGTKASIEANPTSKCMICARKFSNYLPNSNIGYQTWRSNGQYVWFVFWRLGVQTSSNRQMIIAFLNTSVEAGLDNVLPCSSTEAETAVFNKRLNVCCSCSLLACDTTYLVEHTNISVTEIYAISIFRVEYYAKKWNDLS